MVYRKTRIFPRLYLSCFESLHIVWVDIPEDEKVLLVNETLVGGFKCIKFVNEVSYG